MQHTRPFPCLHVLTLALAAWAGEASALGFGPAGSTATLGQTLDFVVPLRLEAGETLSPDCVDADVTVGEQRLAPAAVRTRLEGDRGQVSVRVTSLVSIDEPVVNVVIGVGCPRRLSRGFVLFADPAPNQPVVAPAVPVAAPMAEPAPAAPAAAVPPPQRAAVPATSASAPAVARVAPGGGARQAPRPRPRRAVAPADTAPVAAPTRPRLRLDVAEPPVATVELIAAAASAAAAQAASQAAAQATAAAASRIAALEQSITKLRADSAADRESLARLRERAAGSDDAAAWLPWLGAAMAALVALSGWLALRLRRLQAERQQAWWRAAAAPGGASDGPEAGPHGSSSSPSSRPPNSQVNSQLHSQPSTTGLASPLSAGGGSPSTRPGALGPVFTPDPLPDLTPEPLLGGEAPVPPMERTQPLPVGWREEPEPPRDVSIEELIDLEQQAEFFIVLGQEDAAIDLLVDHLRSTGGGSPLPYLKLLEIYRRRGDREAYDRMRARFNHRFNAYAPDWDSDPQQGRSLEDYPAIIARLQMAWPSPIDAMAELESLLFRKARGELFDMPAYRDVLFLYSLARDLLDREPLESGNVDVLLPISEGQDYTQPLSLEDTLASFDSGRVPLDNAPTVPVDLDVTQPVIPDSLFGEPTDPGINRRRH